MRATALDGAVSCAGVTLLGAMKRDGAAPGGSFDVARALVSPGRGERGTGMAVLSNTFGHKLDAMFLKYSLTRSIVS